MLGASSRCDQEVNNLPPPPPRQPQGPQHQPPNITYGDLKCEGPRSDENDKNTWYDPRTLACWFYPDEQVCTGITDGTGKPDNGAWRDTGKTCAVGNNYALISNIAATPARPDLPGPGKQQFCFSCTAHDKLGNPTQLKPPTDMWAVDSSDADWLFGNICTRLAHGSAWTGSFRPGACPPPPASPAAPPPGQASNDQVDQRPTFCLVCDTNKKFTEYKCADLKFNYCTVNLNNLMSACPHDLPYAGAFPFGNRLGNCSLERKQPGLIEVPSQAFP